MPLRGVAGGKFNLCINSVYGLYRPILALKQYLIEGAGFDSLKTVAFAPHRGEEVAEFRKKSELLGELPESGIHFDSSMA